MKTLRNLLGIHFSLLILCSLIYTFIVWIAALIFPSEANGLPVRKDGRTAGFENIGQKFTHDKYFWGRPSASDYNAGASYASNRGPSNPEYLKTVSKRIDTFLAHNPAVKKSEIPVEMITASGSGLDPHISSQGAMIQTARISQVRAIPVDKLKNLVVSYTEKPLLGLLGPERVNVLKLNLALDSITRGMNYK